MATPVQVGLAWLIAMIGLLVAVGVYAGIIVAAITVAVILIAWVIWLGIEVMRVRGGASGRRRVNGGMSKIYRVEIGCVTAIVVILFLAWPTLGLILAGCGVCGYLTGFYCFPRERDRHDDSR